MNDDENREALLELIDAVLALNGATYRLTRRLAALSTVLQQKGVILTSEIAEAAKDLDRHLVMSDDPKVDDLMTLWKEMEERLKEVRRWLGGE